MRRYTLALAAAALAATTSLAAADFWIDKPFLDWSDKDVEKMMTGSPWATVVGVALPPALPVPSDDVGGRGGRGGGGDSFGPGPRRIRVTLSWRSALPVKQALVRMQIGQGGTPTADQQAFLAQEEPLYVLAMTGLPPQYARPGGDGTVQAVLKRKDLPDIPAQQAGTQKGAGGLTLLIGFPRGEIALEDREVEVVARFDRLEIKRKFRLQDMVFAGKLEM